MPKFTHKITQLNPNQFVNDDNLNEPLTQLQNNILYLLNLINGNQTLLSGVYGNLSDFNGQGKRLYGNGGKFDSYKKANSWTALNSNIISNDTELIWDEDNSRIVYIGQDSATTSRSKWLEREIWIPTELRGQSLVFAMKASGSTDNSDWSESNAVCETVGIQIIGSEADVQTFKEVGPWSNHEYYANDSYGVNMRTIIVPFTVSACASSIKIKILRTKDTDYLHIDKIFIGGLAMPYDNDTESYDIDVGSLQGIDIHDLYDFDNDKTKVISTSVLGHKVPDVFDNVKGNDLLSYYQLNQHFRDVILKGSLHYKESEHISGISGTCDPCCQLVYPVNDNVQGIISLNQSDRVYNISHPEMCNGTVPMVSLTIPSSGAQSFQTNIFNVNPDGFDVVLSDIPSVSGYELNWSIGNTFSPFNALKALDLPVGEPRGCEEIDSPECDNLEEYPDIFNFTD